MRSAICTIVAKNYLPYARVLMQGARRWIPEALRFVILVDTVDSYFDPAREDFEIILSHELAIPDSRWFHFKYTILELSTAVKPYALDFLIRRYDISQIVYFDPDIQLFAPFGQMLGHLRSANILLTPHLTAPIADERRPGDLDILRSGAYNLGFIALASSEETFAFLRWWQNKLYDHCVVDLPRGLFVDQRWVDLAPGMFSGVKIVREPGYNVAYWNLSERLVERAGDHYVVNGQPLYFFHFSGFNPANPEEVSKHQDRYRLSDLDGARDLILDYRDALLENGFAQCKKWPYAFGAFANGFPIPDIGRPAHHESGSMSRRVEDPFSDQGFKEFIELWNQPVADGADARSGISRLAYRIYRTRSDVQAAMPDIFGGDRLRFLEWLLSSGKREHDLDEMFLAPAWSALESAVRHREKTGVEGKQEGQPLDALVLSNDVNSTPVWLKGEAGWTTVATDDTTGSHTNRLRLTELAKSLYESRPDLQRLFPDPCGRDGVKFLTWMLTYGRRDYKLSDAVLNPLRQQWEAVLADLPSYRNRLWHEFLLTGMTFSVAARTAVSHWRASYTAFKQIQLRARPLPSRAELGSGTPSKADVSFGLNVVGYICAEIGVGESARSALRSARSANLMTAAVNVVPDSPCRNEDYSAGDHSGPSSYFFNLFHINADVTPSLFASSVNGQALGKYNIGYWAWELEEFPDRWARSFDYYREIWTPSNFCQQAILRKAPVPVLRIPHSVDVILERSFSRSDFGIPETPFVFLTIFDVLSIFERKNPNAVIDAFIRAFESSPGRHLVLKVNNSTAKPRQIEILRSRAAGYPVTIIDHTLSREELNGLIQVCDCVVSLHRSEGFGLTLAEAMFLGKPVIATGYSGNLDFTKPGNSLLVKYNLIPVGDNSEPYDAACVWADPDVADAAKHMLTLASNPDLCAGLGSEGQDFIRTNFSPSAVGAAIKERLLAVWQHPTVRSSREATL